MPVRRDGAEPEGTRVRHPLNDDVARSLEQVAGLLEAQQANPFRVRAYRDAAATVRNLDCGVNELLHEQGLQGLDRLPHIGPTLARVIEGLVLRGNHPLLDRLRGEHDPVALLATVPGVGHRLAERLHEELNIDTLEQLEEAAHDGTLASVPGFGEKRVAGIRDALTTRLRRARPSSESASRERERPAVEELLDVDREYREKAAAGRLPRIAPRRFNPDRTPWLSVLHTARGPRHYTALYSNTAHAHQLGKTHDWVVLYFDGGSGERQHTVVTASSGPLRGRRVVRGRELECSAWYERGVGDTDRRG